MTTASSGQMITQAMTSVPTSSSPIRGLCALGEEGCAVAGGNAKARLNPPPTAVVAARKERRLSVSPDVIAVSLHRHRVGAECKSIAVRITTTSPADPHLGVHPNEDALAGNA